jgi:hypothetical protein
MTTTAMLVNLLAMAGEKTQASNGSTFERLSPVYGSGATAADTTHTEHLLRYNVASSSAKSSR